MNLQAATPDCLNFTSLKGGTVQLAKRGTQSKNLSATFQYSTDGTNWYDYEFTPITLNKNQTIWFRAKGTDGKNTAVGLSTTAYFTFTFGENDSIAAGGNIMSLYDASCEQTTMTEYGFYRLFQNARQLVSAPKLPATTLASNCYNSMFKSCFSLATAPDIKPETLAPYCFKQMFYSCDLLGVDTCANDKQCEGALLTVPATSAEEWNTEMFKNCYGDYTDVKCGGHYSVKKCDKPQAYVKADGSIDTCKTYTLVSTIFGSKAVTWNAGWYVVKGAAVNLTGGAICNGEVHLILADGAQLTAIGKGESKAGILVSGDNNSLTIYGQEGQTGKLIATGYSDGAGIGGGNGDSATLNGSNITINGGVIEATGVSSAAGIGGGIMGNGSNITINGGTVTATTGHIEMDGAAGIGGGQGGQGSKIYINGGTVTAIGANSAAGIGAGQSGSASNIFISPFVILKADNNNPPTTEIAHTSDDAASLLAGKQYATAVISPCYAYNNWETESTWSWKQMDSVGRNTYQLENVVFGGTGINFNGKEDNAGAIFVNVSDFAGDAVQANDTVSFTFNTSTHVVTMTLVGRPVVDYACQIGTKGYVSIAEAVAAVQAGETIQVLKDIQLTEDIYLLSSTPAFTLDMNGHILDGSNMTGNYLDLLYVRNTLSIIDSNPTATHEAPFDTIAGAIMTGGRGSKSGESSLGGAIYVYGGTVHVDGITFVNNNAKYGGAVDLYNSSASTFKNCRFYGDSAQFGGAVFCDESPSTSFTNCRFEKNTAQDYGSAIDIYGNTCTIDNCVFIDNHSYNNCGAIYSNQQATVNIKGSEFINNTAPKGGAAYFYESTSTFTNCRFEGNNATKGGAAVYVYGGQSAIDSCVVKNNSTTDGILLANGQAQLTIAHTTITENNTTESAGAIGVYGASLTLNDGTVITNNTSACAYYPTGGMYVWTNAECKNSITLSGKVIIKDNTTNGKPANLCLSGDPVCDTIALNGLSEGSEIHVCTMLNDVVAPATFVANATEDDLQYFKSDNGYAFVLDKNGKIVSKQAYGRKLEIAENYGTICLDKQFIAMEGVEGLYVPAIKDATKLYCEEVELKDVVAGGAYIFKSNADSVTFAMDGEAVAAAVNNDHMIGWLAADSTLTAESDYYGLSGNTISKLTAGHTIKQNCALIDLDNVSTGTPAPGRKYVSFDYNGPTGVVDVNANVNANRKVMVNGQLIIIRDGKKFNAMGQEL